MKGCVSLEMARKLKEAGFGQHDTAFHYYQQIGGVVVDTDVRGQWILRPKGEWDKGFGDVVAAPTIGELLEALPKKLEQLKGPVMLTLGWSESGLNYAAYYENYNLYKEGAQEWHMKNATNPADALALLWINLKVKNLV